MSLNIRLLFADFYDFRYHYRFHIIFQITNLEAHRNAIREIILQNEFFKILSVICIAFRFFIIFTALLPVRTPFTTAFSAVSTSEDYKTRNYCKKNKNCSYHNNTYSHTYS